MMRHRAKRFISSVKRSLVHHPIAARILAGVTSYRKPSISAADWERDYASGTWSFLNAAPELARYSIIAGYCRHRRPPGRVLDVGCGEGLLAERLGSDGFASYVGVDLSATAVAAARARGLPNTGFVVADAETFEPGGSFDVFVFNEIAYYLGRPDIQMERLSRVLNPNGVIIVSLLHSFRSLQVWQILQGPFSVLDKVHVRHATGNAWDVALLQPQDGILPDDRGTPP